MHLDDILDRAERFKNELIILSHLSTRTSEPEARRRLARILPESLQNRVMLWESSVAEIPLSDTEDDGLS